MTSESSKEYVARMERERHARVIAAAKDTIRGACNTVGIIECTNGVYVDRFGRKHVKHGRFKARVLGGMLRWSRIVPSSVGSNIVPRPNRGRSSTGGACVVIPCILLKRRVAVQWMHGRPPWFLCRKDASGISDSEFIAAMHFNNINYGQFVVSSSPDAPFFILKYGVKSGRGSDARLSMLEFCMAHNAYKGFRKHIREAAWDIIDGGAKVDLTVLRLATQFVDFVKHPRIATLFDLDKEARRRTLSK